MKVPVEYLGMAIAVAVHNEPDPKKQARAMVIARLLNEDSAKDSLIAEGLMICLEATLRDDSWKWFKRTMKGRFVVHYEGKFEDPTSSILDLFYWLKEAWRLVLNDKLTPDCLDVKGRYVVFH